MNFKSKEFNKNTPYELNELYEKNSKLFNELADDAIRQACMVRTPEQTLKLQQIQWTIDAQLRKGKTPLGRMQIMESIFYDQVYGDDGQLDQLMFGCTEFIRTVGRTEHISGKKTELCLLKK